MKDPQSANTAADEKAVSGLMTWLGLFVAVVLALFLVWWMPARVASGYAALRITGSVASLPARLPVLWVRSWPWQTVPPSASVVFTFADGAHVTALAKGSAPSVGWLSGRAVPASLTLQHPPSVQSNQIVSIEIEWPGGQTSSPEPALWISAPSGEVALPGAEAVWTSHLNPGARVGVQLPIAQNPDVISLSSPNPLQSPWSSARCVRVPQGGAATLRSELLQGKLPTAPVACGGLKSGDAIVVAQKLPASFGFVVWQPVVQEVVNSHIRTLVAGPVEIGSTVSMTAANWWKFAVAPPPVGF